MNFDFTEKEQVFFDRLRREMTDFVSTDDPEQKQSEKADRTLFKALVRLAQTGYLKLGLEKSPQGFNGSLTHMRAGEILAGISPSLYLAVEMGTHLFGKIVNRWGSPAHRDSILPDLKTGRILGAVAVSEQAMNVDNDPMRTTAELKENDTVVISGSKSYVVNAPMADHFAVVGRLDDEDALFFVRKKTPGVTVGKKIDTLGYEGAAVAGIDFSSCEIAAADVIQGFGKNELLGTLKRWENQILVGASLGLMQSSIAAAKKHADSHETGGKPVKAYQAVGFKLAEMLMLYQTSQLLAYRAAWSEDNDKSACADLTLCAKVFCSESAESIASQALQVMSGKAYFSSNHAERAFRCSKYGQIAGTSSEIARVKLGDGVLGYKG